MVKILIVLLALSVVILSAVAFAQANGIRIYADRVDFDWPSVESCANYQRDTLCRVAWAAYKQGRGF
jgi:hypothetical protein